jgi:uncharacterized Zn finger protein
VTPAEFGATPWGRAWVRTIERTTGPPNPLLPKARNLARHRATLSVGPGRVEAEVASCQVRIDVPAWPEPTRAEVSRLAAEAATRHHGLAAGDLPDALVADLDRHGIAFAVRPDETTSTCHCRTRRRPCVHVLAAVYALAQLVDERPALALELRSLDLAPTDPSPDRIPLTSLRGEEFYRAG